MCGTCKRDRVLAHQAAGRAVVFIGDGESDRYAAGYSDIVWAKRSLVRICLEAGWPFHRWTEFREIEAWLAETLTAWAADPDEPARTGASSVLLRPRGLGRGSLGSAGWGVAAIPLTADDRADMRGRHERRHIGGPNSSSWPQPHPSQRAKSSNGTQPRLRLGERTSGMGRPTGMTPIGVNSSGIPR